jgi:hypothetical protein
MGIWAKRHSDAATALGTWAVNNPLDAASILSIDCSDRKQFKQKITEALNDKSGQQDTQSTGYDVRQHNYHYGNAPTASKKGFETWCRQYPKAAKTLRIHCKALCKTGLGILNGRYKVN